MSTCWAEKPADRPSFADVLWMLTELRRTLLPTIAPPAPALAAPGEPAASSALPMTPSTNIVDDELPASPPSRNPLLLREN